MSSQPVVLSRVYARGQVALGDLAVILHLLDVWGKGPPQHRGVVNPHHLPYLDTLFYPSLHCRAFLPPSAARGPPPGTLLENFWWFFRLYTPGWTR